MKSCDICENEALLALIFDDSDVDLNLNLRLCEKHLLQIAQDVDHIAIKEILEDHEGIA